MERKQNKEKGRMKREDKRKSVERNDERRQGGVRKGRTYMKGEE